MFGETVFTPKELEYISNYKKQHSQLSANDHESTNSNNSVFWRIVSLANEVFGFNGWSHSLLDQTIDYLEHKLDTNQYSVGVTSKVCVQLKDGAFHEDFGFGVSEDLSNKAQSLENAKRYSVENGVIRTLQYFVPGLTFSLNLRQHPLASQSILENSNEFRSEFHPNGNTNEENPHEREGRDQAITTPLSPSLSSVDDDGAAGVPTVAGYSHTENPNSLQSPQSTSSESSLPLKNLLEQDTHCPDADDRLSTSSTLSQSNLFDYDSEDESNFSGFGNAVVAPISINRVESPSDWPDFLAGLASNIPISPGSNNPKLIASGEADTVSTNTDARLELHSQDRSPSILSFTRSIGLVMNSPYKRASLSPRDIEPAPSSRDSTPPTDVGALDSRTVEPSLVVHPSPMSHRREAVPVKTTDRSRNNSFLGSHKTGRAGLRRRCSEAATPRIAKCHSSPLNRLDRKKIHFSPSAFWSGRGRRSIL